MIPWRFSWNNFRLRPVRNLLTILSIAGGVAAVVAVLQSTAATRLQLDSLHQRLASRVAMEIQAKDASAFPMDDAPSTAAVPEIQAVIPIYRVFAKVVAGREEARGVAIGVEAEQYRLTRDFTIVSGRMYRDRNEVCLESSVAERLGVVVGDEVRVGARGLPWLLSRKVTGILKPSGIGAIKETASIFMPLEDGAKLGKSPKKVTALQIVLEPQTKPDKVAAAIKGRLPENLIVTNAASAADMSQSTEALIRMGLNAAATLSVVAAIFIVINTFQISVAERQRQFALLRIVGATTEQVGALIHREAFVLGAIGTLAGIFAGVLGSTALSQGMQDVFGFTNMVRVAIRPEAILGGLIFGPLVVMVSVWQPARTACEAPMLRTLKAGFSSASGKSWRNTSGYGFGALVAAALMFVCSFQGIFAQWTSIGGIALVLMAGLAFLPILIERASNALYRVIGLWFGVEALLGQRQLLDHFGRTSLTAAVLFVVSATSISIGSTTLAVTRDIESWLDRTLTADFLLRASRPRVDMSESEALPADIAEKLKAIPGIIFVDQMSFSLVSADGVSATLMVRQLPEYKTLPLDLVQGEPTEVRRQLLSGGAVVGAVLANRIGCTPGDVIRIELGRISHTVQVAGVAREYTAGGLMIIMDRAAAQQLFPLQAAQVYGVRSDKSAVENVGVELRRLSREHGLIYQSLSDLRNLVRSMVSGLTSRLWTILVLALIIAAFAIVNTLTMNVIEQTRHLGVLRVVGILRMQVFRMFVLQALVLSLLALIPGTIVGVVMSFLITTAFQGVSEYAVEFVVDPVLLLGYLACGVSLSLMAAVLPAIRAGRLKPLEAIHED
jgi:putative ABC transport system permease protein